MAKRKGPSGSDRRPTTQKTPPRSASRRKRDRRREEAMRALSHPRRRTNRVWIWGAGGAAVAVALIAVVLAARGAGPGPQPSSGPTPTPSPTANPAQLAPVPTSTATSPIDGIQCQTTEQIVYHIHAHLAVYVNGAAKVIPEGIGIPPPRHEVLTDAGWFAEGGACFYWLHTHTADGIVHIESPAQQTYTLGNFFDIWGQTLTSSQVGPASGTVIAYVDGQRFTGDLKTIPLTKYTVIQLDVGADVPPLAYTFPPGY